MMSTTFWPVAGLVALAAAFPVAGAAQEAYPSRPITLVVPFPPGSGTDVGARLFAKDMTDSLRQNVVVDNRPGANGALGAQAVARAKPDGYTLLAGAASTNAANYAFYPGKLGYEPASFEFVGGVSANPVSLFVSSSAPWKTVGDLIADLKKQPGKFACGSGVTVTQVVCEVFKRRAGVDLLNVSYKGPPLALSDLVGGQVHVVFSDGTSASTLMEAKRLRVLATAAARRLSYWPDVPTFVEMGMTDVEVTSWTSVFVPAGTPLAIRQQLNAALRRASEAPEVVSTRQRTGSVPLAMSLDEGNRFIATEVDRWSRFVKDSGVKPE